ncbi:MAG: MBL fold metallo-hydrolase, partial [Oscillospiraceae bacterium]|nr:MBL fold metallo-hydrolase [Oscillospiraceae bacterium]
VLTLAVLLYSAVVLHEQEQAAAPVEGVFDGITVHILDIGNADSILIQCGGQNMLIDAGEREAGDRVVGYLRSLGVKKLDTVIVSHPDSDHIGGMPTVVGAFPPDRFIMAFMPEGKEPTTASYKNLLKTLGNKGVNITPAKPGLTFDIGETSGNAAAEILGPVEDSDSTNNQSVVCMVTYGSCRFLFMGDAEKQAESALLGSGADLRADFIKLAHHGSRTSTTKDFIQAVSPTVAVISCGAGNRFNHPHEEILTRLEFYNITYYRTDLSGTVIVSSDGEQIAVQTER